MSEPLLSTAEAARILGVTPATVRLLARSKKLAVAVMSAGGIRLFDRRTVMALDRERRARGSIHARRP